MQKNKSVPSLHHVQKLTQNGSDQNIRAKTPKFMKENKERAF
jgi:hypothetical protein